MPARKKKDHPFLAGGGEAADIIAGFDWQSTSLGPNEGWPPRLKSSISLILSSQVPIVTRWGEDGIMIYNDAYSAVAGGRHPDLFGSKVREGWPEVADFNDNVMKVGLAGGNARLSGSGAHALSRTARGAGVVRSRLLAAADESGKPVGVMAIVIETTGKMRAERELDAERQSLRRMFEQAPGFIAVTSGPEHRFTMVNKAYSTLIGHREVLGKTVCEAMPEVTAQGFVALLDQVYRTGQPFVGRSAKFELQHGPNEAIDERYLDFIYQPIVADGATTGIFLQGHDVTEQKRNETALRESEERFRLVAENAPVMLWMGDENGPLRLPEQVAARFLGRGRGQAQFLRLVRDRPSRRPQAHGAVRDGDAHTYRVLDRDPHEAGRRPDRTIRTNAQPRFGPRREFIGMIGVNVDVTRSRQTEKAIRSESRKLSILNRSGAEIAAELDVDRIVEIVTDACTELVGAQFGSFFYNVVNDKGESYMLYALSGVPREAFSKFPMPRETAVFQPTFNGEGVVRSDDILLDPRYGEERSL